MFDRHFILQIIREKCISSIYPEIQSSGVCQKLSSTFDSMLTEYLSEDQVAEIEGVWTELSAHWMEMSYICGMRDFLMFSNAFKEAGVQKLYEELLDEAVKSRRGDEMSRVVFHIPHYAYVDGKPFGVYYEAFQRDLEEQLSKLGVSGWYYVEARGAYCGRNYREDLLIFLGESQIVQSVIDLFRQTVKLWDGELRQEQYCYELDNELVTFSVDKE